MRVVDPQTLHRREQRFSRPVDREAQVKAPVDDDAITTNADCGYAGHYRLAAREATLPLTTVSTPARSEGSLAIAGPTLSARGTRSSRSS